MCGILCCLFACRMRFDCQMLRMPRLFASVSVCVCLFVVQSDDYEYLMWSLFQKPRACVLCRVLLLDVVVIIFERRVLIKAHNIQNATQLLRSNARKEDHDHCRHWATYPLETRTALNTICCILCEMVPYTYSNHPQVAFAKPSTPPTHKIPTSLTYAVPRCIINELHKHYTHTQKPHVPTTRVCVYSY